MLSVEIKTLLYNSLILSHINYCITAWGFQPGRILKLQKKTVRIITLSKYNSHADPIFKRLHFLKVDDLFTLQQLKLYYNYSHNNVPIYFQNWQLIPNCNVLLGKRKCDKQQRPLHSRFNIHSSHKYIYSLRSHQSVSQFISLPLATCQHSSPRAPSLPGQHISSVTQTSWQVHALI